VRVYINFVVFDNDEDSPNNNLNNENKYPFLKFIDFGLTEEEEITKK
jgi:hypothetical protein